jgi:hypothetical protein
MLLIDFSAPTTDDGKRIDMVQQLEPLLGVEEHGEFDGW